MNDTLLCKDCKHSFRPLSSIIIWGSGVEWRCREAFVPTVTEHDPVTGPRVVAGHYQRCSAARGEWKSAVCGADAKLWTPRHKRDLFKLIKKETY